MVTSSSGTAGTSEFVLGNISTAYNVIIRLLIYFQNFDSSESKLRREFEVYGPIRKVCCIHLLVMLLN
jgi:hypothetical protein